MTTPTILPVSGDRAAARVAALARTIWQEHYTPIIGARQVEYMLTQFQSASAIARQTREGTDYFLIVWEGEDAGYFALHPGEGEVMLSKLYVAQPYRQKGLARAALRFSEAYGRKRGAQTLWLTVNKRNSRAVEWYERMGFDNTGPVIQNIGMGFVMDDYRMEKGLRP